MKKLELTDEQAQVVARANAFQEELVGLIRKSQQRLREEAGEAHQFLPPIQLLANESEHLRQTMHGAIGAEDCERALKAYFEHQMTRAYARTRIFGQYADPFELTWALSPERRVEACAHLVEPKARIEISFGTCIALQDIALRMVSSEDFYNPYPDDSLASARWEGGRCRAPISYLRPTVRYYDYAEVPSSDTTDLQFAEEARRRGWQPSVAGQYLSKMPVDESRLNLANIMVQIAVTWVFCHEEAHLRLGHLLLDGETWSPPTSGLARMSETTRSPAPDRSLASQVLEWQADRFACEHTLCAYLGDEETFANLDPELAASWAWRVRLIASSIGLAICLFNHARTVRKSHSHPHPAIRMCLALGEILKSTSAWQSDYMEWNRQMPDYMDSDPEPYDRELGMGYTLIAGTVWDVCITLEIIGGRTDAYRAEGIGHFLDESHDVNMVALALAWEFGGRLQLRGGKLEPDSRADRRTLEKFVAQVALARDVKIDVVKESWNRAIALCNEMRGFVDASNSTVEELRELARGCVVKSFAHEPWARVKGPNAHWVDFIGRAFGARKRD